jgi:phenylacetic acid degradation protein
MPAYMFEGLRPVVHPDAYVHPTATLIGDVVVAARCYIGPGASLRGDIGRIIVNEGANVQDNCIVHCFPGKDVVISQDAHIGHGAILHGCHIGHNALIGMNAIVMDNAVVNEDCVVGAGAFVRAETCLPQGSLWVGSPARQIRQLSESEREWKRRGTAEYQDLARRCLAGAIEECFPLTEAEPDRKRFGGEYQPLGTWRQQD